MKFTKTYPVLGDKKTKMFFAFLPFSHELYKNGKRTKETRWLEFVTLEYQYSACYANGGYCHKWYIVNVK